MRLTGLAARNIQRNGFRSLMVALCVLVVSISILAVTMIIRGAENDLRLEAERLGADIVVVPKGVDAEGESALFMGKLAAAWMPESVTQEIARVPGVAAVSPQLYLASVSGAPACAAPEMFLVAYDPQTDFTVRPWLRSQGGDGLKVGESFGGSLLSVPKGESGIRAFGQDLTLKANLESTGTSLDQTLFVNFETAREVARASRSGGGASVETPSDSVSAVLVKVLPGANISLVTMEIEGNVSDVNAVKGLDMFRSFQGRLAGIVQGFLTVLTIIWGISVLVIGLVFSVVANERRREIAVMRALGSTWFFVFRSLLVEAMLLALLGSLMGSCLAGAWTYLLRGLVVDLLGVSFLLPSPPDFLALVGAALALAVATVILAALFPAYRVSRQDPALAMRE